MSSPKLKAKTLNWLLLASPFLSGCALVLEYPMTSASVGLWGTTGKGPTDHAVSYALNEDCETLRAINSEPICKKNNGVAPEVVDKSFNPKYQNHQATAHAMKTVVNAPKIVQKTTKNNKKKSQHKTNKKRSKLK
jgi:hypothetical protein